MRRLAGFVFTSAVWLVSAAVLCILAASPANGGEADDGLTSTNALAAPDARTEPGRIQALMDAGKLDEAGERIAGLPDGPEREDLHLDLAQGYFRKGEVARASGAYDAYFARVQAPPADPERRKRYLEAAYMASQVRKAAGDLPGTLAYLERMMAAKPDRGVANVLCSEASSVLIELARHDPKRRDEFLNKADEYARRVSWPPMSLAMGDSVVALANVSLLRGDRVHALEIVEDYREILINVDRSLEEWHALDKSPLARLRYVKAEALAGDASELVDQEAKALKLAAALQEYTNIVARYGGSPVAPQAARKVRELTDILTQMGFPPKFGIATNRLEKRIGGAP
jgi:tetratricopeptide (TPR) repeat protein